MPISRIRPDGVRFEPETLRPQAQTVNTYYQPPADANAGKDLENAAKGFKELADGTREALKYQAAKEDEAENARKALQAQQHISGLVSKWNDAYTDQYKLEEDDGEGGVRPGIQNFDDDIVKSGVAEAVKNDPKLYAYVVKGIAGLRSQVQNRLVQNFEAAKKAENEDIFSGSVNAFLAENADKDYNDPEVIAAAQGLFVLGTKSGIQPNRVNDLMMGVQHAQTKLDPTQKKSFALQGWLVQNKRDQVYSTRGLALDIQDAIDQAKGLGKVNALDALNTSMARLTEDNTYLPEQMSDALSAYVQSGLITPAQKDSYMDAKKRAWDIEQQVRGATKAMIDGSTNFFNFDKKYQEPAIERALTLAGVKSKDPLEWDEEDVTKAFQVTSRIGATWEPLKNILEKATPSDPENFDRAAALYNNMAAKDTTWTGRLVSAKNATLYEAYNQTKRLQGRDGAIEMLKRARPHNWDDSSPEAKQARERLGVAVNGLLKDGDFMGSKAMNSEYIRDRLTREALLATYIGINPDIAVKEAAARIKESSLTVTFDVASPKNLPGFFGNKAGFKPVVTIDTSNIPAQDKQLIQPAWMSYSKEVLLPQMVKTDPTLNAGNIMFMPPPVFIAGKEDVVLVYKMDATTGGQPVPTGHAVSLNTAILYHKQKGVQQDATTRDSAVKKIQATPKKDTFQPSPEVSGP